MGNELGHLWKENELECSWWVIWKESRMDFLMVDGSGRTRENGLED